MAGRAQHPVPMAEQRALLQDLIAEQQRACLAHDRHASHSPELADARWRKLRALRAVRASLDRWNAVLLLKSQLADVIISTTPAYPEEDAHAAHN